MSNIVGLALLLTASARAQCPADWLPGEGMPGVNGAVRAATAWDPDGPGPQPELLVVGGSFEVAGDVAASKVAAWDGTRWQPMGSEMAPIYGSVQALTVYNGELIAGGSFTSANGVSVEHVARWNGLSWQPMGSGLGTVQALMVHNGELIAGTYTTVARWDGTAWQPLGSGASASALTAYNGELIAASGSTVKWWNGSAWQPLGLPMNHGVFALAVYNGQLIAGGQFTSGFVSVNRVARWRGYYWEPLGGGLSGGGTVPLVYALTVYNGDLIAGGNFTMAEGMIANGIARWNGSAWQTLASGMPGGGVSALALYKGELIAGGAFSTAGGVGTNRIARWNGSAWRPVGSGMNCAVQALAEYNGDLVAGGCFIASGGDGDAASVARWDGAAWQPLGGGIGGSSPSVRALLVHNGELIAGGNFTTAGGVTASSIARWDGAAWHPLGSGMDGSYPSVRALAVHKGELVAGGYFATAGGVTANAIARWDGASWHPLGTGMEGGHATTPSVDALAVYQGELIAGGTFTAAGGVTANSIARWDGSAWQPLGAGVGDDPEWDDPAVFALAVYNGELIAGGQFATAGSVYASRIARWNGSDWEPMASGMSGFDGRGGIERPYVDALTQYNGELIAGGGFTGAGAVSTESIARWDGSDWQSLGSLGISGLYDTEYSPVHALAVHGCGLSEKLVAGGNFITAGNEVSAFWARFGPSCAPGDVDEDGVVGWLDFQALLAAWGPCAAPCVPACAADLDGDGTVGILDFLALLLNWD